MMLFWLAAAALTAMVLLALLKPLWQPRHDDDDTGDRRLAIYRDQLDQLARDRDAGLIAVEAAAALELEVQRHVLALPKQGLATDKPAALSARVIRALILALALGVPAASFGLYAYWGTPDINARLAAAEAVNQARPALSIDEMVARLEARLKASPGDATGWQMLGRSMRVLGRPDEAIAALEKARALAPDDSAILGELAEAMVQAAEGVVTPQAATLFQTLRRQDPGEARAPYYLALARAQAGDAVGAIALWRGLAVASPADAPWLAATRARIDETAAAAGLDPALIAPEPLTPAAAGGQP